MENFSSIILVLLQIILIDTILSADNALVLGGMVSHLPQDAPVPATRSRIFNRVVRWFGHSQHAAALQVGIIFAYTFRIIGIAFVTFLMNIPYVKAIGGAILVVIALTHLLQRSDGHHKTVSGGFWETIVQVELMDLGFSLDNVLYIALIAEGHIPTVMVGVLVAIIIIRTAAKWLCGVMEKIPSLRTATYVVLAVVGGEMAATECFHFEIDPYVRLGISIFTAVIVTVVGMVVQSPRKKK